MYFLYQRIDVENKDTLQKNWLVTSAYVCVCVQKIDFQSINQPKDIQDMQFTKT